MAETSGEEALTGSWAHPERTLEASTAHCHTGAEVTPTDAELELCSEVHVLTDLNSGLLISTLQWWEDRLWNPVW